MIMLNGESSDLCAGEELSAALAHVGVNVPQEETWCDQHDGRIAVTLPAPPDENTRNAAADVLDAYALEWRFA